MKKYLMIIVLAAALMLQGCSGKEDNSSTASDTAANQGDMKEDNKVTEAAPTTAPTATPTQVPEEVLPVTVNDTGKVLIQTVSKSNTYPFNSYIITSAEGENVIVDPTAMPKKEIIDFNPAAIVATHNHPDHTDPPFTRSYDCQQLLYTMGEITTKDFKISSIASSHNSDNISDNPSNILFLFEVDGLRIVHMGDIGQTALTQDQLKALGDIDIAFMQFENSYSTMNLENKKGFNLIEQLNPKIIIPTHYTEKGLTELKTKYGEITEYENMLAISKEDIPEDTLNVYVITNSHKYPAK